MFPLRGMCLHTARTNYNQPHHKILILFPLFEQSSFDETVFSGFSRSSRNQQQPKQYKLNSNASQMNGPSKILMIFM